MKFCPHSDQLICGEIGRVRSLKIVKGFNHHTETFHLEQVLEISKHLDDEWVMSVYYDESRNRIFAGCGTSLFVYSCQNGKVMDRYYDIHSLSITCITFYEPSQYLITGSKDGTIKIWNARKAELYDFHEHYNEITGFLLLEHTCEADRGTLPLLLSSSMDATIRMWNFETGQSLYRIDTFHPCLGISLVKKNYFFHYTVNNIQLWNMNRYQHTFTTVRSRPKTLERVTHKLKPCRIIVCVSDGSIRLVSPVSGTILGTGFPSDKDLSTEQLKYDYDDEKIYCLQNDGSIIVYDAVCNPFKITNTWSNTSSTCFNLDSLNREIIECICALDLYNFTSGMDSEVDKRILWRGDIPRRFLLLGGTSGGQIHLILFHGREKQEFLCQAHSSKVIRLFFDRDNGILVSLGHENMLKIWSVELSLQKKSTLNNGEKERLVISLKCLNSINIEALAPLGGINFTCFDNKIAIPNNGGLLINHYTKIEVPIQEKKESSAYLEIISNCDGTLWATSHEDHTVKVYDQNGSLIREIQMNDPISCIAFANRRGDLLVGISDQISLIKIQDYLSPLALRNMLKEDFSDDEIESPMPFNEQNDFWGTQDTSKISKVEVENQEIPPNDTEIDNLLELSKSRRTEATIRRNKRNFLESELHNYQLEVAKLKKYVETKRQYYLKQKGEELLKDTSAFNEKANVETFTNIPQDHRIVTKESKNMLAGGIDEEFLVQEAYKDLLKEEFGEYSDLDNLIHSKLGFDSIPRLTDNDAPPNPTVNTLPVIEERRMRMATFVSTPLLKPMKLEDRINIMKSRREGHPQVVQDQSADTSVDDLVEKKTQEKSRRKSRKKSVAPKKKGSTFRKRSSMPVPLYDENSIRLLLESSEDTESTGTSISEEESQSLIEEEKEKETHKRLLEVSTLQYQMDVKDLQRIEKLNQAKIKTEKEKAKYIDGMEMPNSIALPDLSCFHLGRNSLRRGSVVFQGGNRTNDTILEAPDSKPDESLFKSIESIEVEEKIPMQEPKIVVRDELVEFPVVQDISIPKVEPKNTLIVELSQSVPLPVKPIAKIPSEVKLFQEPIIAPEPSLVIIKNDPEPEKFQEQKCEPVKLKKIKKKVKKVIIPVDEITAEIIPINIEENPDKVKAPLKSLGDKITTQILKTNGLVRRASTTHDVIGKSKSNSSNAIKSPDLVAFEDKGTNTESNLVSSYSKISENKLLCFTNNESKKIEPVDKPPLMKKIITKEKEKSAPVKENIVQKQPKISIQTKKKSTIPISKHEDMANLAEPIMKALQNTNQIVSNEKEPITIESISKTLRNELHNPPRVKEVSQAIVAMYKMFKGDMTADSKFDTFVAPFLDAFESPSPLVRKEVLKSIVEVGIQHDNVLILLVTALADKNSEVREASIKGLGKFGIADKDALKRAMIELGILRGKPYKHSYEFIDQIAASKLKEYDEFQKRNNQHVENWLYQSQQDIKVESLQRKNSYFEHLAGPFFPPDAHDFEANQRAKGLMMEAAMNSNYEQYWKEKVLIKAISDDNISIQQWDKGVTDNIEKFNERTIQRAKTGLSRTKATIIPPKPVKTKKPQTSAHIAAAITRAMVTPQSIYPKIIQKSLLRPFTAAPKDFLTRTSNQRPNTTATPRIRFEKNQYIL